MLRADAPVFVPFSGKEGGSDLERIEKNDYYHDDEDVGEDGTNKLLQKKKSIKKKNRQTKLHHQNKVECDQSANNGSLCQSDYRRHHRLRRPPARRNKTNQHLEQTNNESLSHCHQPGKRQQQQQQQQPSNQNSINKRNSTSRRSPRNKVQHRHHNNKEEEKLESNDVVLSLSAFPSLTPSLIDDGKTMQQRRQKINNSYHIIGTTTWTRSPNIVIEERLQDDNEKSKIIDDTDATVDNHHLWMNGLEKLTTKNSHKRYDSCDSEWKAVSPPTKETEPNGQACTRRITLLNSDSPNSINKAEDNVDGSNPENTLVEGITYNRRPKLNIDRLRDKWWEVLSTRRKQQAFLEELNRVLKKRRIQEDDMTVIVEDNIHRVLLDTSHVVTSSDSFPNDNVQEDTTRQRSDSIIGTLAQSERIEYVKEIIKRNDEESLGRFFRYILENGVDYFNDIIEHSIEMTVMQCNPNLLRTIVSIAGGIPVIDTSERPTPLMLASERGNEECLSILLSKQDRGMDMLFAKDGFGNNVLHYACRGSGSESLLRLLLKHITGNAKGKQQNLSKVILSKNDNLETPLHVACRYNRVDFVDILLKTCNSALLSKVLAMEDIDNQTPILTAVASNASDIVVALIMWRGNHCVNPKKAPIYHAHEYVATGDGRGRSNESSVHSCPLVWAAKKGNLEMIETLLQFGEQCGTSYLVKEALPNLLLSDASIEVKLEGSYMLASLPSANPFVRLSPSSICPEEESSVGIAASIGPPVVLRAILSAGTRELKKRQLDRRKDPKLQQQPDSFFCALELKENMEMKLAIKNALLATLLRAHLNDKKDCFSLATILYEEGGELNAQDLSRLHRSLVKKKLQPDTSCAIENCLVSIYDRDIVGYPDTNIKSDSDLDYDRSPLAESSFLLLQSSWIGTTHDCCCSWVRENSRSTEKPRSSHIREDVIFIAEDGSRFPCHGSVVATKSGKLESAIRFAAMNNREDRGNKTVEIEVPIPSRMLSQMLQHFYHGSICCNWPCDSDNKLCRYLLELMFFAEEFICLDLVKEIEMRLLSSDPKICFCFSCCRSVRQIEKTKTAQCMYFVDGKSRLLNENTVFDVMGLTEYMESPEYVINLLPMSIKAAKCASPKSLWNSYDGGKWRANRGFDSMKQCVNTTVLQRFSQVVSGSSFRSSVDISTDLDKESWDSQKEILLQMAVDDLQRNYFFVCQDTVVSMSTAIRIQESRRIIG